MDMVLVLALFACSALALNFLVQGKTKLVGALLIADLCLNVAIAYQFKLIQEIVILLIVLSVLAAGGFIFLKVKKSKDSRPVEEQQIIEAQIVDKGDDE